VLDADLPGMSGFEICRQLKSCDSTRALPIIFCSGNADASVLAMDAGADRVLCKPAGVPKIAMEVSYLLELTARK
jgi:DNA-binding response OmpR family regulator